VLNDRAHRRAAVAAYSLLSSLRIVIVSEGTTSGVDGDIWMMNVSSGSPISSPIMGTAKLIVAPLADPVTNVIYIRIYFAEEMFVYIRTFPQHTCIYLLRDINSQRWVTERRD